MTLLGDVPETVGYVDATKPPHAVDGLTLEGLPPQVKVEVRGNVSRRPPCAVKARGLSPKWCPRLFFGIIAAL